MQVTDFTVSPLQMSAKDRAEDRDKDVSKSDSLGTDPKQINGGKKPKLPNRRLG